LEFCFLFGCLFVSFTDGIGISIVVHSLAFLGLLGSINSSSGWICVQVGRHQVPDQVPNRYRVNENVGMKTWKRWIRSVMEGGHSHGRMRTDQRNTIRNKGQSKQVHIYRCCKLAFLLNLNKWDDINYL
jgi:hypothetical protein